MTQFAVRKQRTLIVCLVMLGVVAGAGRLRAASLTDYRLRVSSAIKLTEEALAAYDDERIAQPDQVAAAELARLREVLPPKESVLFNSQNIAVDNSWLYEMLSDFEKQSNARKRTDMLARIDERLRAVDEHLQAWEKDQARTTDKDAEKGRLAEILRRPEYNQKVTEGSALQRLLERFFQWLSSLFPKTKPMEPARSRALGAIAQIVVVGVCLLALLLLAWRFVPRFMQSRRKKKPKREARIVLGERLEPDQTAADLLAEAEQLARAGDLRAAIRKGYIALLCELGDRKIISIAQHKTNRDYLNSVRDKSSLYISMRKLTQAFELHWYGFKPAGEGDWQEFRNGYHQALRTGANT